MIITPDTYDGKRKVKLATYASINDFADELERSDYAKSYDERHHGLEDWAGGDLKKTVEKSRRGDERYARQAEKWVEQFSNVALQDYALENEHNTQFGMVDVGAWLAGEPEHLYGPTITHTDRAPVAITLDQWIQCTVPTDAIVRRGVAAVALTQALSMYRPVVLYIVLANRHTPSSTDAVQIIPAPTSPMDSARAGLMVAAPYFVRAGMMPMLHHIAQDNRPCGIPALSAGRRWQTHQLPKWLAPRIGVNPENMIHLPMMYNTQEFDNDANALAWVRKWVKHYAD